jgi:hypothetical protein
LLPISNLLIDSLESFELPDWNLPLIDSPQEQLDTMKKVFSYRMSQFSN